MLRSGSVRKANIEMGGAPSMAATMEHTRLGLLYFFSHIEFGSQAGLAARGALSVVGASTYFAAEMGAKMVLKAPGATAVPSMQAPPPSGIPYATKSTVIKISGTLSKEIFDLAGKAVKSLDEDLAKQNAPVPVGWRQEVQEVWTHAKPQLMSLITKGIENAIFFVVPYLKSAWHLVESIEKIVKAAIDEYKLYRLSQDVGIHSGSSEIIIRGVNDAGNRNWSRLAIGAAKSVFDLLAETLGAAVLKSFVGFVESVIESTVGTIWKMFEIRAMTKFCDEAKKHLQSKDSKDSIHRNPAAFAAWIRGPFARIPMLPCLAIKSRICGDYTTMASLVDDDGMVVGAKQFADTRAYFDLLIKNADTYLKNNDLFVKGRGEGGMFMESLLKDPKKVVFGTTPPWKEPIMTTIMKGQLAHRIGNIGDYAGGGKKF